MAVILSPHLDDAVLSLGQFMQTEPCTVVTVFAGSPRDGLSDYDASCGFTTSAQAMTKRLAEDDAALGVLGVWAERLQFLDLQYGQPTEDDDLAAALAPYLKPDVMVPLGLGHPDHVQVARCVRAAAPVGMPLFFYEESPYRTLWPEQAHAALVSMRLNGWKTQDLPFPFESGTRKLKARAIAEYRSQFPNGADDPCLLVPERCWRAKKCD
jgi:LmbE family N-acetylglucosaminyl deacetylase